VVTANLLNPTVGSSGATNQQGMTRLWRLTFDDITNPLAGGVIDLLIDGQKSGFKVQMFDNMTAAADGRIYINEDPGNSTYIGKAWAYDVASDTMVPMTKFDPARWGDLAVNGGPVGATSPWTNDKETSGILDVSSLFPHAADETVLLLVVQDHSTNAAVATASSVEGGQLLLMKVAYGARTLAFGTGCNMTLAAAPASRPALGTTFTANVGAIGSGATALMMVGASSSTFVGVSLPLDLGFAGLPGCFLYQDLALEGAGATTSTGANSASYALPIPAGVAFTGLTVYLQSWSTALETSNALSVTLGL
jgi:hypothetical protein